MPESDVKDLDLDLDLDLDVYLDDYLLHPQPQHSLRMVHAFMCADRAIEHVCEEKVPTENGILRQEQLIWCIKQQQLQKRALSQTHFKLRAMFLYNMDLEPEELRELLLHSHDYTSHDFIMPISAVEDVVIRPTIPMFAHMNALYIMYEASNPHHEQHSQHNHNNQNSHNQSKKRIIIQATHSKQNHKHKHTRRT